MKHTKTDGLLKIGELARASGVSVSTIKYYISQGFLQPELKTSANMAYYSPASVERIILIKQLQREKYYPLSLIRELLSGQKDAMELDLLNAIHKISPAKANETLPVGRAAAETGLAQKQVDALVRRGVVSPGAAGGEAGGEAVFDIHDSSILRLVKRRCDAGLPFEQTLESFGLYAGALNGAVREDVDVMVRCVVAPGAHTSSALASLIRMADATLDEFVSLKRDQLDSQYSALRMGEFLGYIGALAALQSWLPGLEGGGRPSLQAAGLMARLCRLRADLEIAMGSALLQQANRFFSQMDAAEEPNPELRRALYTLRLGFYALAPPMFGWQGEAARYEESFAADCAPLLGAAEAGRYRDETLKKLETLKDTYQTKP